MEPQHPFSSYLSNFPSVALSIPFPSATPLVWSVTNVHHSPLTLHPHQRTGRLQKKKLGGSNYNLYFLLPRAASSTACTFPVRRTTGSLIIPAFANKFRETSSWFGVNVDVRVVPSLSPFFFLLQKQKCSVVRWAHRILHVQSLFEWKDHTHMCSS